MIRLLVPVTLAALLLMPLDVLADNRDRFETHTFSHADYKLPYRLLSPAEVKEGEKYPLVLFLHGAGERGNDNRKQLVHGMSDFASDEVSGKYPAFVVAPQCPEGEKWADVDWSAGSHQLPAEPSPSLAATFALLDKLIEDQPIDRGRVYITGLSMGGYGTWDALARRPQFFAAAVPVCGGGDPDTAEKIKHIPLWTFHGSEDRAVKPERSREMIAALQAAGGQPKYTEYPGVGHDSWSRTYSNPALYEWLFAQRRESSGE